MAGSGTPHEVEVSRLIPTVGVQLNLTFISSITGVGANHVVPRGMHSNRQLDKKQHFVDCCFYRGGANNSTKSCDASVSMKVWHCGG